MQKCGVVDQPYLNRYNMQTQYNHRYHQTTRARTICIVITRTNDAGQCHTVSLTKYVLRLLSNFVRLHKIKMKTLPSNRHKFLFSRNKTKQSKLPKACYIILGTNKYLHNKTQTNEMRENIVLSPHFNSLDVAFSF